MMFSSIVVSGIQLYHEKMTSRNLTIVSVTGCGYGMGAHATILSRCRKQFSLYSADLVSRVPAAFMAIILNVLLPKDERRNRKIRKVIGT